MFTIEHRRSGKSYKVVITLAEDHELKQLRKDRYWFDWNKEKDFQVCKLLLCGKPEILGLMSLDYYHKESRIQIRLLAVSRENKGKTGMYRRIAGNLIAYACSKALYKYGVTACVSLIPKTGLRSHYMREYGFKSAGMSLFLEGPILKELIKRYKHEKE